MLYYSLSSKIDTSQLFFTATNPIFMYTVNSNGDS